MAWHMEGPPLSPAGSSVYFSIQKTAKLSWRFSLRLQVHDIFSFCYNKK